MTSTHQPSADDARGSEFVLRDRHLDVATGALTLEYELDGAPFVERFVLPVAGAHVRDEDELDLLVDLCHVTAGTSYFKLSAPRRIVAKRPMPHELLELGRHTYDDGLREFAVTNGLPVPLVTEWVVDVESSTSVAYAPRADNPLVPIGGGKDSAAVLSMLDHATGLSIAPTGAPRTLAAAAGVPLLEATRTIDPVLLDRVRQPGAMNGHVPITAINSSVSALIAYLLGFDSVVMANERSANEPTRMIDGVAVNHQYSKSYEYEVLLQRVLARSDVAYFSMVRQLSELSIAGIVAQDATLRSSFLSCNRAFRQGQGDAAQSWCLECPKCLFTFLCFAVFCSPDEAATIFGGNPLDDPAHTAGFRDLWHPEAKPFDCVGERQESASAMMHLATSEGWKDCAVVRAVAADAAASRPDPTVTVDDLLVPTGHHGMPASLAELVRTRAESVHPHR